MKELEDIADFGRRLQELPKLEGLMGYVPDPPLEDGPQDEFEELEQHIALLEWERDNAIKNLPTLREKLQEACHRLYRHEFDPEEGNTCLHCGADLHYWYTGPETYEEAMGEK